MLKNKVFFGFSICTAILLFLFMIMALLPKKTIMFNGDMEFETGRYVENYAVYQGISLQPGVYRIQLEYETDSNLESFASVKDSTVIYGGLLSNYEHFYSQLGKTDFEVWLFEKTDAFQVCVNYSGKGELKVGNLTIIETRLLWTMLMTALVSIWFACIGIMLMRGRDRRLIFCLALVSLAASYPFLFRYNISGADFTYHLQRIEGLKDGMLAGFFPVRLEPRWVYDHGYADAVFYCNLFLFLPAVLRMTGFPVSFCYNIYGIVVSAATVGISYYSFSKIFGKNAGVVCSALYSLSVFRIYKFVITSAVGEGTAYTFLPLILYGFYRLFTENPQEKKYNNAWVPACLGICGVIHSHVLTCEISALVILLFCILFIKRVFVRETFLGLCKMASMAFFLGAWFLIPFVDYYMTQDLHVKNVSARTIQNNGLEIAHLFFHFWRSGKNTPVSENGLYQSHPVGIGLVLMGAAVLFAILWFSGKLRYEKEVRVYFSKKVFLIGCLLVFMSTNLFPWDRIQAIHPMMASLVSSLQFPNRFLGWGTCCFVMIFGECMRQFSGENIWQRRGVLILAAFGILTSSIPLAEYSSHGENNYMLYNPAAMGYGYISGAEYVIEGTDYMRLSFAKPVAGESIILDSYEKRMLGAVFTCHNMGDSEEYVKLPLLLYKGYHAKNTTAGQEMMLNAGDNGEVCVKIPAGFSGRVVVQYISPFYWRIAEMVSLLAVIIMAYTVYIDKRRVK